MSNGWNMVSEACAKDASVVSLPEGYELLKVENIGGNLGVRHKFHYVLAKFLTEVDMDADGGPAELIGLIQKGNICHDLGKKGPHYAKKRQVYTPLFWMKYENEDMKFCDCSNYLDYKVNLAYDRMRYIDATLDSVYAVTSRIPKWLLRKRHNGVFKDSKF